MPESQKVKVIEDLLPENGRVEAEVWSSFQNCLGLMWWILGLTASLMIGLTFLSRHYHWGTRLVVLLSVVIFAVAALAHWFCTSVLRWLVIVKVSSLEKDCHLGKRIIADQSQNLGQAHARIRELSWECAAMEATCRSATAKLSEQRAHEVYNAMAELTPPV